VSKSEQIRQLATEGLSCSDIAKRVGISYQFAYNVLSKSASGIPKTARVPKAAPAPKPTLMAETLLNAGFVHASRWMLDPDGYLKVDAPLSKEIGVYAFVMDGVVVYVGVATGGLKGRLYGYQRPGIGQQTNLRLNDVIKTELAKTPNIDILVAMPGDMEWNGLPVHGAAGLELGIIKKYALPWNVRSAR